MADSKISALTALTGATIATNDELAIVDTSAVETKRITVTEFFTGILGSTSITGATVTTSQPILDLAQTWNAGAVTFTGLKLNVTDTASLSTSLLIDLQVGGSSIFSVRRTGIGTFSAGLTVTGSLDVGVTNVGATISATRLFQWGSSGFSSPDVFLGRNAAASLRLGAADAAAPVAQTLGVQSVVAGTSNTAGTNFTIKGSAGTGTGAGGSIIFQVAAAGSSGTAQNAFSTALTINSSSQLLVSDGSNTAPTYAFSGATNKGFYRSGGVLVFADSNADIWWSAASNIVMRNNGAFAFSSGATAGTSTDLLLVRDAANTLALRNGTNAQRFRVYNTWTDASNGEWYSVDWQATANTALVGPTKNGTGTQRVQRLQYLEDGGSGSTTPSLGTTCPAASATVKSWIKVVTSDGTTAYIPCWA